MDILHDAFKQLEKIQKETNSIQIRQVKEKHGSLRLYLAGPEEAYDIEEAAEEKSRTICEYCGRPGKLRGGYWKQTLCDDHHNKKDVDMEPIILDMLNRAEKNR